MTAPVPPARPRATSLVAFFAMAALLSALAFLPQLWQSWRGAASVPAAVRPLQLLLFFGPGALAIAFAAREGGRRGVVALLRGLLRWRVSPLWYAAVLLLPLVANLAALAVARALGATAMPLPSLPAVLPELLPTLGAYLVLNTEELAWRGWAWPRLRDRLGALRGAILLGAIWGALHAPLFLMRGGHPGGWPPALFLAMTIAFGVLLALVYEGTGGSILLAHLLHQSINAWGDTVRVYPRVTGSVVPAATMTAIAALLAALGAWRAGWRWSAPRDATGARERAVA